MRMNVIAAIIGLIVLVSLVSANGANIPVGFKTIVLTPGESKDLILGGGLPIFSVSDTVSLGFVLEDSSGNETVSDGTVYILNHTYKVKAAKLSDVQTKEVKTDWVPDTLNPSQSTLKRIEYTKHTPTSEVTTIDDIPFNVTPTMLPEKTRLYLDDPGHPPHIVPVVFVTPNGHKIQEDVSIGGNLDDKIILRPILAELLYDRAISLMGIITVDTDGKIEEAPNFNAVEGSLDGAIKLEHSWKAPQDTKDALPEYRLSHAVGKYVEMPGHTAVSSNGKILRVSPSGDLVETNETWVDPYDVEYKQQPDPKTEWLKNPANYADQTAAGM